MADNDVNWNAGNHGNHMLLDTSSSSGITLDEPDLLQMRQDRQNRTRATMKAVNPQLTAQVLPKVDNFTPEQRAATRIQAQYRGHLGRKKYLEKLYEQFEREEAMRLEKSRVQCEQGELLVENHRLSVQLDDNNTTRRNRSRQYNTHVITIQRAWRSYSKRRDNNTTTSTSTTTTTQNDATRRPEQEVYNTHMRSPAGTPNNNMSPLQLSDGDELSDTESANGAQAMSVSTPDDASDKNDDLVYHNQGYYVHSDADSGTPNDGDVDDLILHTTEHAQTRPGDNGGNKAYNVASPGDGRWNKPQPKHNQYIEPEPDSCVSDYSEMADPLKEHLANVQIIQQEDLDAGNTMCQNQFSVGQKIMRSPEETEEEFTRRLRKINYLSLAQEFAALKKIDAHAQPFDDLINKGGKCADFSPMSDTASGSETDLTDNSSAATTPMDAGKTMMAAATTTTMATMPVVHIATTTKPATTSDACEKTIQERDELEMVKLTKRFERAINPTKDAWGPSGVNDKNNKTVINEDEEIIINKIDDDIDQNGDDDVDNESADFDDPDVESVTLVPARVVEENNQRKPSVGGNHQGEKLGDFDVYNIETTLPQLDWNMLEEQLHKAAEEERQKQRSRRTDREEIRRKLAMGVGEVVDDPPGSATTPAAPGGGGGDYYGGERMFKKPNLQTRLQSGMNLQICFMNEATSDVDSVNGDDNVTSSNMAAVTKAQVIATATNNGVVTSSSAPTGNVVNNSATVPATKEGEIINTKPSQDAKLVKVTADGKLRTKEEDEDFFAKQAKLQDEARMALAQVRPMAHMQLEVEKQMRKKSPIAEMVGIPALGAKKKFGRHVLNEMNVAQLQVVVNDLHSQIETLNEELVMMLVGRDDLHMEQDSMLVDIEDHHRRALEVAARVNKPKRSNKKK